MEVWSIVYQEVSKESPVVVLTFLARSVYGWSLRDLSNQLGVRSDFLSRKINVLMHRIRQRYEHEVGDIGRNEYGRYDGHLVAMEGV